MAPKKEFKYESIQDKDSIIKYFESVMQGIKKDKILLQNADDELIFHLSNLMNFEIKAKQKNGVNKIELQLSWKDKDLAKNEKKLSIN
jgi:amphi-Trp domain-containing protein